MIVDRLRTHEALTHLSRLTRRKPDTSGWLEDALRRLTAEEAATVLDVAGETGGPIADLFARLLADGELPTGAGRRVVEKLEDVHHRRSASLRKLGRVATEKAVASLRGATTRSGREELALRINQLGFWLRGLGRWPQALDATREATDLFAALAIGDADAFERRWADSLQNLGMLLGELGRPDKAVPHLEQAVAILRRRREDPESRIALASGLYNLSATFWELGRFADALDAIDGAIALHRRRDDPRRRPDLAAALHNLATILSDLGRGEEAVEVQEQSIELRRELAAERPEAFAPELASSLHNLGAFLAELGRLEDAIEPTRKAVALRRRLVAERPRIFEADLASSLHNLGNRLRQLGLAEAAVGALREATAIYRRLATASPDVHRAGLASSLHNLGLALAAADRKEAAADAVEEAVGIGRALASEQPPRFRPLLARHLHNLANRLAALQRVADARDAAAEAVRELTASYLERPSVYRRWMSPMVDDYLELCRLAGAPPDEALLEALR